MTCVITTILAWSLTAATWVPVHLVDCQSEQYASAKVFPVYLEELDKTIWTIDEEMKNERR